MASNPAPMAPTTFHPFLKLPCELQEMIWNIDLSQLAPRFVHINRFKNTYNIASRKLPPALFAVSRHSRAVAARKSLQLLPPHQTRGIVFFRPDTDLLLFGKFSLPHDALCSLGTGPRIQDIISATDLGKIKKLCFINGYRPPPNYQMKGPCWIGAIDFHGFILNCDVFKNVEVLAFGRTHDELEADFYAGGHDDEIPNPEQVQMVNLFNAQEVSLWQRHVKRFPGLKLRTVRYSPMKIHIRSPLGAVEAYQSSMVHWTFRIGKRGAWIG